jgi:hypothetical protein
VYKDKGKQKEASRLAMQKMRSKGITGVVIPDVIPNCSKILDSSSEVLPPEILADIETTCATRARLNLEDDREARTQRAKEYQVWRREVYPILRADVPVYHELVAPKGPR